ncbi:unnamed protein product, partial [Iphiclides podalirius]
MAELRTTGKDRLAVYFPTYSTWDGKAMMLRNLFVRETYRRHGVGRMLFCSVAAVRTWIQLRRYAPVWISTSSRGTRRVSSIAIGAESLTESQDACYYMLFRGVHLVCYENAQLILRRFKKLAAVTTHNLHDKYGIQIYLFSFYSKA